MLMFHFEDDMVSEVIFRALICPFIENLFFFSRRCQIHFATNEEKIHVQYTVSQCIHCSLSGIVVVLAS